MTNNYVMGGASGFGLLNWEDATVTGNTIYVTSLSGKNSDVATVRSSPAASGFNWNGNTYHDTSGLPSFKFTSQSDSNFISWTQWRQTSGLDSTTTYSTSRPTWNRVFVRPNQYQPGRAHIIVYGFNSTPNVSIDVSSVLSVGDNYEIRDAQNFGAAPLASGVYAGSPLQLTLTQRTAATPIGFNYTPPHTGREFSVYVLIRR
jgi:hypothetical protein